MIAALHTLHRVWRVSALAVLMACACGKVIAQTPPSAASVKAAYIYKFLAYVEWPANSLPADAPLVIGIVGADPVRAEIEELVIGKRVNGRRLVARTLSDADPGDSIHVVFVSQRHFLTRWSDRLKGKPVLIISDVAQSVDQGSMLGLIEVDGRIRFEAAPTAAERAGLRLSARLLTLADRVVSK